MSDTACPVCGTAFPEEEAEALGAFKHAHRGRVVWFDSTTCRDAFVKDPEKFLSRLARDPD